MDFFDFIMSPKRTAAEEKTLRRSFGNYNSEYKKAIERRISEIEDLRCGVFSLFQKVSNERQRSVLIDFYINNQTLEQISENLNLSVSSVKRLKKKGLKTAKAVYERGNNKA